MTDSTAVRDWIAEMRELEKRATAPEWRSSYRGDGSGSVYQDDGETALIDDARCPYIRGEVRYEDGELCVAARNALPALLDCAQVAVQADELLAHHDCCRDDGEWQNSARRLSEQARAALAKLAEACR